MPMHYPQPEGDNWAQPELDNWAQPEGYYWQLPERDNWQQLEGDDGLESWGSFPLNRQPLMYSRPIRSMSIDQLLETMTPADQVTQSMASVCGSAQGGDPSENFNLQRQGSLALPSSLSPRTEDEVWKELIEESGGDKDGSGISGSHLHQRTQTFGEMALEDSCNENEKPNPVGIGGVGTGEGEMEGGLSNSGCSGKMKRKEKTPGGGKRGNKKTTGDRIAINLEDTVEHAARHLKVSKPKLKTASWDYGIQRWSPRQKQELIRQSYTNETSVIVDEEGISQLNYDTLPSDQPLVATIDTNSGVVIKSHPPQFLPKARQENPDGDFGNYEVEVVGMGVEGTREGEMEEDEDEDFGNYDVEAVGMGVERTGEGEMEEGQLNSGCLEKGKSNVETPGGDRGNKKTKGIKIVISLEDILQAERMYLEETGKQMSLDDVAKKFKVSRSTIKRACRKFEILSWPPRKEHELISQSRPNEPPAVVDQEQISRPNEPPAVVDQEQIPQLNSDILLLSDQVLATIGMNNVTIMARYGEVRIKFRLSWPWRMVELEQQVKKRLHFEAGTYYIKYKDVDDELTLIACDEDLEVFISSSSPLGTHWIEVFLEPKVAHELRVNQL